MSKSVLYVWLPVNKRIYPAGPVTLANYIHSKRQNVSQFILDLSLSPEKERAIVLDSTIRGFDPDIICFSWRDIQIFAPHQEEPLLDSALNVFVYSNPLKWIEASFKSLFALKKYNNRIRENTGYINAVARKYPSKQVYVGGGAFSVFHRQLISMFHDRVIGVVGEGEEVLLKVIDDRSIENEKYVAGNHYSTEWASFTTYVPIFENLIDIPYTSKIFRQHKTYQNDVIGIQTKRGCGFKCQYCLYPYIEGCRVRIKDPQVVVTNIENYITQMGATKFWFVDGQFVPGEGYIPHCEDILQNIMDRKLELEWSGYVRTSLITSNLAHLMVQSGVGDLEVSITSGSQAIIDDLNLGFRLEEIYRGCRYLREAGFKKRLILNYSLNTPGATEETLMESIKSYKKIKEIMGSEAEVLPFIFFLGIQPNTMLEKRLLESGYLHEGYNPLSLEPSNAEKLLYNPPPLKRILAEAYKATKRLPVAERGRGVFEYLEKVLAEKLQSKVGVKG